LSAGRLRATSGAKGSAHFYVCGEAPLNIYYILLVTGAYKCYNIKDGKIEQTHFDANAL
jgi:hypothetical protein